MKVSKEFKVGLLALVSTTILYIGFNFLRGIDFFSSSSNYYVVYDEIEGLSVSNNVILNGFVVGRVSDMSILPDQQNQILVELDIDERIVLGEKTEAVLKSSDVLGTKVIELIVNEPIQNPIEEGDTLIGEIDRGIASALMDKASPIANDLESILNNLQLLLQANAATLDNTAKNVEKATESLNLLLNESRQQITQVTNDLSLALREVPPVMNKYGQLADTLKSLELAETLASTQQAMANLNDVLVKIDQGQGTLGKLVNNDAVYENLTQATEALDKLLVDLRENPNRYVHFSVFGRKNE